MKLLFFLQKRLFKHILNCVLEQRSFGRLAWKLAGTGENRMFYCKQPCSLKWSRDYYVRGYVIAHCYELPVN